MESARELTSSLSDVVLPYSAERQPLAAPETVILQVDTTVSSIDGVHWLAGRRGPACLAQLAALERSASADAPGSTELPLATLKLLRPRRSEINELAAAYASSLVPGVVATVAALRRAGVSVVLASDVSAEALFGVAAALGVGAEEILAPHLRFDALGAFVGCAAPARSDAKPDGAFGSPARGRWFVGTRPPAGFTSRRADAFVAFTGVVAREGRGDALATVGTFHELAALILR